MGYEWQQVSIVFGVSVDMVEQSPVLKARFKPDLSRKRLIYKPSHICGPHAHAVATVESCKGGKRSGPCVADYA